jgi:hypothetical protein
MTDETESWYLDENIPGSGPRPDFLESKYKSVAAQAKAYKEARAALGSLSGAPDAYDFSNYQERVQIDNPAIKNFAEYAKSNRINQDAFNKVLDTLADYEQSQIPDLKAELAKLDGGEQRFQTIQTWAKNNLSQSGYEVFDIIPKTAQTIAFFDELRQKGISERQTGGHGLSNQQIEKPVTLSDLKAELNQNYKKYQNDPHYRQNLENRMRLVSGD